MLNGQSRTQLRKSNMMIGNRLLHVYIKLRRVTDTDQPCDRMASNADTPKRFLDPSVIDNRCRTCWIELSGGQRYRIFSVEAVRSGLRARIKTWFGCEVSSEDGLPDSICRRCYRKLEAAQKLVNEIAQIKHEASDRYRGILQEARFKRGRNPRSPGQGLEPPSKASAGPRRRATATARSLFPASQREGTF